MGDDLWVELGVVVGYVLLVLLLLSAAARAYP